jgi:RNA polymerase sigma factor (sigma-70 family)
MIKKLKDEYYIRQYLDGNSRAFGKIIDHYKRPLFSFILKMVQNKQIAEDIFQETFMRVIKNIGTYKEKEAFSSWLFHIAHNICKDHWRKNAKEKYNETVDNQDFKDSEKLVNEKIEEIEDKAWLESEISNLPEKLREVVLLYIYGHLTFKEISLALDCSINTVLGRMHYAKLNLIEKWGKKYE